MEFKNLQMEIFIKESIKEENSMVRENTLGSMALLMKGSFSKEQDMARVAGNPQEKVVTFILDSMKMIRNLGMVDTFGLTAVSMKENFVMI